MEDNLIGRKPHRNKTSQEDDLTGRQFPWKMTSMEYDLNRRQPQCQTTSMKDNFNGKQPQWKTNSIEANLIGGRQKLEWSWVKLPSTSQNQLIKNTLYRSSFISIHWSTIFNQRTPLGPTHFCYDCGLEYSLSGLDKIWPSKYFEISQNVCLKFVSII